MAIYGMAGILALLIAAIILIVWIGRVIYGVYRLYQYDANPEAYRAWSDKKTQKTIRKIKRRLKC